MTSRRDVDTVLAWLERTGTRKTREGMARYAIPSDTAFGVTVGELRKEARRIGRDHDLALGLWETGRYEARTLAAFIDEPDRVTAAQMDRWCDDFDSWAICDTVCFHLFDRAAPAWEKVHQWAERTGEFQKRAAFALLWSLSSHDRKAPDDAFLACLPLIEEGARDERNFVKKGVDMALRAVGKRNAALNAAAVATAGKLAASDHPAARWVGKKTRKELTSDAVTGRLAGRRKSAGR
jgi:3-methyladenine DNA glycosylase AlkD